LFTSIELKDHHREIVVKAWPRLPPHRPVKPLRFAQTFDRRFQKNRHEVVQPAL